MYCIALMRCSSPDDKILCILPVIVHVDNLLRAKQGGMTRHCITRALQISQILHLYVLSMIFVGDLSKVRGVIGAKRLCEVDFSSWNVKSLNGVCRNTNEYVFRESSLLNILFPIKSSRELEMCFSQRTALALFLVEERVK